MHWEKSVPSSFVSDSGKRGFVCLEKFCLEKRLSKHKMTIFSKNFGGTMAPLPLPGYAYAHSTNILRPYSSNSTFAFYSVNE